MTIQEMQSEIMRLKKENDICILAHSYQGEEICLKAPWRRITMFDAIKEHTGYDFNEITTDEAARAAAQEAGLEVEKDADRGNIINLFFEEKVHELCYEHAARRTESECGQTKQYYKQRVRVKEYLSVRFETDA